MSYEIEPTSFLRKLDKVALKDEEFKIKLIKACQDKDDERATMNALEPRNRWYQRRDPRYILMLSSIYSGYLLGKYGSKRTKYILDSIKNS